MQTILAGAPSFSHLHVDLEPGEQVIAEADAMATMHGEIGIQTRFNGGFLSGLCKKFLGGESLFINQFTNHGAAARRVTFVQPVPGQILALDLQETDSICLQPGAYLASTPEVRLGLRWAGLASFIGREGLFKLMIQGPGTVWYGAYGALLSRQVDGEYIVDSGHLVAYEPQLKLKTQMAGGIFSSFFSGEGLVTRVVGQGRITIQTRSLSGLKSWLNPKI